MKKYYSVEQNVQLLVAHLKAHNIRRVIASPGTQHMAFLGSLQFDSFFEIYSCVDERSAAYMAVGMAAESGEPVVICCTGATASRNYLPALTEAFYRKLPIIAVTATHEQYRVGHLVAQQIDRSQQPKDVVIHSEHIERIHDEGEEWDVQIKLNRALQMLCRDGGGPIHFNLETKNNQDFSVKELPKPRLIKFVDMHGTFPEMKPQKIAVFCGAHHNWDKKLTEAVDVFCHRHNAVVFCDHTSNYTGKYRVQAPLLGSQDQYKATASGMDLLIHIGEITGAYEIHGLFHNAKRVWRVSEDGAPRDLFHSLEYVFDMPELCFFTYYGQHGIQSSAPTAYLDACQEEYEMLFNGIPEDMPFSNIWVAKQLSPLIPASSVIHFSILNSLRAWNYFQLPPSVLGYCNVGGFGIDGAASTLIGASLLAPGKIFFGMFGDLAFFYDMNALGNRHVGNNIRILMVNNGRGQEFRNYIHPAFKWGASADDYVAASGHFGNMSHQFVKHMAEDLGYEYFSASNKEELQTCAKRFLTPHMTEKPMFFEVFTDTEKENEALYQLKNMKHSGKQIAKNKAKELLQKTLGENAVSAVKKILG